MKFFTFKNLVFILIFLIIINEGKYIKSNNNWQCKGPRFKNIPTKNDISNNCMKWQYSMFN